MSDIEPMDVIKTKKAKVVHDMGSEESDMKEPAQLLSQGLGIKKKRESVPAKLDSKLAIKKKKDNHDP